MVLIWKLACRKTTLPVAAGAAAAVHSRGAWGAFVRILSTFARLRMAARALASEVHLGCGMLAVTPLAQPAQTRLPAVQPRGTSESPRTPATVSDATQWQLVVSSAVTVSVYWQGLRAAGRVIYLT
jgi:hypothetical protein